MTRFYFHAHPADLEAETLDAAFARLRGEIGVDGVIVDAVAPRRLALRPRLTDAPRIAAHEAAAWFQPNAKHYANARLRPNTATAVKSRNALARIVEAAAEQGLAVRAAVNLFDNEALVSRHATIACVDLFGRSHESRLCPSHPDVREFAASVVEDVATNFEVEAVELGDIHFGHGLYASCAGGAPLEAGVPMTDDTRSLLGWCFCPACRQRADEFNIEADGVVAELTDILSADFALRGGGAKPVSFAERVASSEQLSAYAKMRTDSVTSLVRGIRRRCSKPLPARATSYPQMTGLAPNAVADFVDGFVLSPPTGLSTDGGTLALSNMLKPDASRDRVIESAGGRERVVLEFPCHPPVTSDGPALVAAVHEAARAGYAAVTFTDYGLAPEVCLDWTRQAIRFARRESA